MPRRDRFFVTVSPPTYDRSAFSALDRSLGAAHAPFDRAWLMARFDEGLEIRMLRDPLAGFVMFQPGRLSWRPIVGADHAIVVHDLRVRRDPSAPEACHRLWAAAEAFARYYGYEAVVATLGPDDGLIAPDLAPRRKWMTLDHDARDTRLVGKILQGPMALPHLPRDWAFRAAACGAGLVIQTTGESAGLEKRADRLETVIRSRDRPVRRECFADAEAARRGATSAGAVYSVLMDGERLGGPEMSDADVLRAVLGASG